MIAGSQRHLRYSNAVNDWRMCQHFVALLGSSCRAALLCIIKCNAAGQHTPYVRASARARHVKQRRCTEHIARIVRSIVILLEAEC